MPPDEESDADSRLEAALELLRMVLSIPKEQVDDLLKVSPKARKETGSIKHIYSHINAMFHCRVLDVPGEKLPRIRSDWTARARWVDEADVDNANISTGHVKVWTLVNSEGGSKPGKSGAPKKSKVVKKEEKGQMKLSFTKVVSVKKQENVTEVIEEMESTSTVEITDVASIEAHDKATLGKAGSPRKKRRIDISSDEE